MKVLLSAVGRRDPFPDVDGGPDMASPGAVLQAVAHIQPDVVYLLPTADGMDATLVHGERTKAELEHRANGRMVVHVQPLSLPDPTDYRAVVVAFRQAARGAREAHGDSAEYHVALSSGAPQFRLAWTLLVLNGDLPARCWEVRAPRFGAEVWEADVRFLEEPSLRQRFIDAWQRCDFVAAGEVARAWAEQSPEPAQRDRAGWVSRLMTAYRFWDEVNWRGALQGVRRSRRDAAALGLPGVLVTRLERQASVLTEIDALRSVEGAANLADLYHNAERRIRARQYVDALARFRRIAEGVAYAVLRERGCTIEREWVALSPAAEAVLPPPPEERITIRREGDRADGRVNLNNLAVCLYFTRELTGVSAKTASDIVNLANRRNRTIAAHGMEQVNRGAAETALERLRELYAVAIPGGTGLAAYPFSLTELDGMRADLLQVMGMAAVRADAERPE